MVAKFHGLKQRISKRDWELRDGGKSILLNVCLYSRFKIKNTFCSRYLLALGSMVVFRPRKGTTCRKIGPLSYLAAVQPLVNRQGRSMDPLSVLTWKLAPSSIGANPYGDSASIIIHRLSRPSALDLDMTQGTNLFGILYTKQPDLIEAWSSVRSLFAVQRK
jgi:hypothetical protein